MNVGDAPEDEPDGWAFNAPPFDSGAAAELLTLALLEDLSALLTIHGFPPLRGYALAELAVCLQRIDAG